MSEDVWGGGGGVHIVSGIQFRRVEIPNGGHKVSKGGQMPPPHIRARE